MDSETFQASLFDNTPESQCYRIRVNRAAIRPDENEIIGIQTYT